MKNIIIGVTGASGTLLAKTLLDITLTLESVKTHLILSDGAKITMLHELTNTTFDDFVKKADFYYENSDISAPMASGTFAHEGMIIIPCSMKTISALACGYSENLLLRSADVCMKEKRKLVLLPRETPLSQIHLQNLLNLSKIQNVSILPPMLSFYHGAKNIDEIAFHIACKALAFFDIEVEGFKRWK